MRIIQTKQLTKRFKNRTVLDHVDLTIDEGEICAVVGRNGAGKSTLFKLLANRFLPTEGSIQLFGRDESEKKQILPKISFMIENPTFFDDFTARQNLEYFRLQEGVVKKERIEEVLHMVKLSNAGNKKLREFSLGMKQRLRIALALMPNPDCIVLDEPTNGLDAEGIRDMRHFLQQLNQEHGVTLVISSHILSELQMIATRFIFLNEGKMIADLSQKELNDKAVKKLLLRVDQPSKTAQLLERNFSSIEYQVLPDHSFEIKNYLEKRDQINALLVTNGVNVLDLHLEEGTLEAYFLELVGGNAND